MGSDTAVIVIAHDEADRLPATLAALASAFPGARVIVADDASSDGSAELARAAGARVVSAPRRIGKGGVATLAARELLARAGGPEPAVVVLCDGDLGDSAGALSPLVEAVRAGRADLAIGAFSRRVGGGFGLALGFARWAIRRRCGLVVDAPISGQRALRGGLLPSLLPFAARFGMEIGMTVDAARAGARVAELELELEHRATGRTLRGFLHRGRQLGDFVAVYLARG